MKKILTAIAAVLVCGSLYAQIDPTVEVSRQYKVNIADIDRPIVTDHSVADSLQKFDVDFDYSIFNRPYTDLYEFSPYQTDSISKVVRRRPPYVMAQVGAQLPLSAEAKVKSQLVARPTFNLGLDADSRLTVCKMDYLGEEDALGAVRFNGGLGASARKAWKTGELIAALDYDNNTYVDTYSEKSLGHHINALGVDITLASADPKENSVFYNVDFNYKTVGKNLVSNQVLDTTYNNNRMSLKGTLGSSFDMHRIYVNMLYQNSVTGRGDAKMNVGILEFMPVYEYARPRFKLRAGARFGNTYIESEAASTIHPEMDVKVEVIKNTLWLRGELSGGNELNSLVDYILDAPWLCNGILGSISSASEVIGTRNLVGKISVQSVIAGRFALTPYISYGSYSNKLQLRTFFTQDNLPLLLPEYSDYANTQIGFESSWKSRNLTVTANLAHNNPFNQEQTQVNMVAEWQAGASLEYNFKRRFFLNAAYSYEGERACWGMTIPDYSNLTVVLTGVVNRHIAVYIKGDNLFNHQNYRYFAIPELPLNIGGGVRINF